MLSIIGVAYPGPARVRALTIYGLVMGVAALAFARRQVTESRGSGVANPGARRIAQLDLAGLVLVTAALTALVLPLVEGTAPPGRGLPGHLDARARADAPLRPLPDRWRAR